jgi:hypothetical protein
MLGMFCLCQRPVTAHGCSRCPLWRPCAATGRWHYSIVRTMTPSNHALWVSFVCSKAWLFCSCCCFVGIVATATVVLQHSSKFVATIAVTARLKFVWQGSVYIWCCGEGVGGGRGIQDPGCSGRQIRGRLRSTLGRCGWRLPTLDVAGAVLWVPQP